MSSPKRRSGARGKASPRNSRGGRPRGSKTSAGGAPNRGGSRTRRGSGQGRSRAARQRLGGDQVEGRQAVRELLLAGRRRVREVLLADEMDRSEIIDDIWNLANELNVPVRPITRRRLDAEAATAAPQGVVARAEPLPEVPLSELTADPNAFLLVLDGITDPMNLGALLRTAECAGVTGVVLGRHRAVHVTPTVTKAAAGAIEHLKMSLVAGIPSALTDLKEAGVTTIGLDAGGSGSVFNLPSGARGPLALVLGAEGPGLSNLTRKRADALVAIPLSGELNSLNVATAGAVACFAVVRHRSADSSAFADPDPKQIGDCRE